MKQICVYHLREKCDDQKDEDLVKLIISYIFFVKCPANDSQRKYMLFMGSAKNATPLYF